MKIALVGSAPASVGLAPYDDPTWTIWGCSPGAASYLKRVDAFFELHRWVPEANDPGYISWLKNLSATLYVAEPSDELPNGTVYPTAEILSGYPGLARSFFTSSLAWMCALAIEQPGVEEIGFWGVDMADPTEYGHQKPGCHFFILEAERRGIRVSVPPESDLLRPIPLYGIGETSPMRVKLEARKRELQARRAATRQEADALNHQYEMKIREESFIAGALDDVQYMLNTWSD